MPHRSQQILEEMRRRPALYVGKASLELIANFLNGYATAREVYNINSPDDALILPYEFHFWVLYRLHLEMSPKGWWMLIREKSQSEVEAIETFFTLLEEFRSRKPHIVAKIGGINTSREIGRTVDGVLQWDSKSHPESVTLVTYTNDPGFFVHSDSGENPARESFFPTLKSFEEYFGPCSAFTITMIDPNWTFPVNETQESDEDSE